MSCLICRSSARSSEIATTLPSTRARTNPARPSSANRSLYSPFCPRMTGASTEKRGPLGHLHRAGHDLLAGQRRQRPIALRAMPGADPGEQDAEVVVDLGDRADGRPRVAAARSSAGSRSRARARRSCPPRAWASAPGTGGHRTRGSRRTASAPRRTGCRTRATLARPADAREADELAARQFERHVPQVMLARASDHDVRRGHPWFSPCEASGRVRRSGQGTRPAVAECGMVLYGCWGSKVQEGPTAGVTVMSIELRVRSKQFPTARDGR